MRLSRRALLFMCVLLVAGSIPIGVWRYQLWKTAEIERLEAEKLNLHYRYQNWGALSTEDQGRLEGDTDAELKAINVRLKWLKGE